MKWLVLLCLVFGLLAALAEDSSDGRSGLVDYTGRYAELASAVPSHVNVPDLIASLTGVNH